MTTKRTQRLALKVRAHKTQLAQVQAAVAREGARLDEMQHRCGGKLLDIDPDCPECLALRDLQAHERTLVGIIRRLRDEVADLETHPRSRGNPQLDEQKARTRALIAEAVCEPTCNIDQVRGVIGVQY